MNFKALRDYCLAKQGAVEEQPFGPDVVVFKVLGKMFALLPSEPRPTTISLKCDPDDALMWRAQFAGVTGGYHLNKKHWNSVALHADVPEPLVLEMIDDSYALVVAKLPKKARARLRGLNR
jgi:predicted DNA-binding protein (MmcQ/YjbR family)